MAHIHKITAAGGGAVLDRRCEGRQTGARREEGVPRGCHLPATMRAQSCVIPRPGPRMLLLLLLLASAAPRPTHGLGWLQGLSHTLEHALLRPPRTHTPQDPPQKHSQPQPQAVPASLPGRPERGSPGEGIPSPSPSDSRTGIPGRGGARGTQNVTGDRPGATYREVGQQGERQGPRKSSGEGAKVPGPRIREGSTNVGHSWKENLGPGAPERKAVATCAKFVPAATIRYDARRWLPFSHVLASGKAFDRARTGQQSCFKLFGEPCTQSFPIPQHSPSEKK